MIKKFNRYELKYVISHRDYRRLFEELKGFMSLDPYAGGDGFYAVTSLYYDSMGYEAYRSKLDGVMFRRKVRIRIYPERDPSEAFVEIKQRVNRTVQKRRINVPLEEARRLCAGDEIEIEGMDYTDRKTIDEIRYMLRAMCLRPSCIVSYRRKALVGCRYDIGLRITFDLNLKYRMNNLDELTNPYGSKYFIPPEYHIMEIKANERVPIWLTSFLAKHQCSFMRVSKYCAGLRRGLINMDTKRTII
jgi:hypothetical protein